MSEEKDDKALAQREAVSLSDLAKAVQPVVEALSKGQTDRTKILTEAAERGEIRELAETRWHLVLFGALPLAAVLFLTVFLYLKNRSTEANDLLKIAVSLAGGYGIGYARGRRELEKE